MKLRILNAFMIQIVYGRAIYRRKKHCDYAKRKFSSCVSVSGCISGTERPIATKFRRQPREKVQFMKLTVSQFS